jgi:hypothetical protein
LPQLKLYRNRNVLHWTNMPKDWLRWQGFKIPWNHTIVTLF